MELGWGCPWLQGRDMKFRGVPLNLSPGLFFFRACVPRACVSSATIKVTPRKHRVRFIKEEGMKEKKGGAAVVMGVGWAAVLKEVQSAVLWNPSQEGYGPGSRPARCPTEMVCEPCV